MANYTTGYYKRLADEKGLSYTGNATKQELIQLLNLDPLVLFTASRLKKIASQFGVGGYSKMKKDELISAIQEKKGKITSKEEAFADLIHNYSIEATPLDIDPLSFFHKHENTIKERSIPLTKQNLVLEVLLGKSVSTDTSEERIVPIRSTNQLIVNIAEDLQLHKQFNQMIAALEVFTSQGSGWTLLEIKRLWVNRANVNAAGTYKPLPTVIQNKKAVINIQNKYDHKCLRYCLKAHFNPAKAHSYRPSSYPSDDDDGLNFDGISFPTPLDQIKQVEKLNNIAINVYLLQGTTIERARLSKQPQEMSRINLLLIEDHYTYIKDFNRLMYNTNKHKRKMHFCGICLSSFTTPEILQRHTNDCIKLEHKNYGRVQMPTERPRS